MSDPTVDLVIEFRSSARTKQEAIDAEDQYSKLLDKLKSGGLDVVGKKGNSDDQLLVFICAHEDVVARLVQRERYLDFLHGIPSVHATSLTRKLDVEPLTPAERIRFLYAYITGSEQDGCLGITPTALQWTRVISIMCLHDKQFNHEWIQSWTTRKFSLGFSDSELRKVKEQFGESLALYFAFLSFYARSLIFPAALGTVFYYAKTPYHPLYSILLCVWSVIAVEWWRVRERTISVRWGTYGYAKVEARRAQFQSSVAVTEDDDQDDLGFPWWIREGRMLASLPVMGGFAMALTGLLTSVFLFEAFISHLYHGPGAKPLSFLPTIVFVVIVPRFVGIYQGWVQSLTTWENHLHKSGHERSMTLKTFAISAIVAYSGLYLSAFVYAPFGDEILALVENTFFADTYGSEKAEAAAVDTEKVLNPHRLQNQVFAYLVTNQIIGTFLEVGLPFITRGVSKLTGSNSQKEVKKKVGWKDETPENGAPTQTPEEGFLKTVRAQAALPSYDVFGDYSEMVTQFGYCVLWSACWPLAPLMALANNWLELRSDAFKITRHGRRPIPERTDSIGPWLEALTFLTWQGALTNSALVFLFHESSAQAFFSGVTRAASGDIIASAKNTLRSAVFPALLIALSSSHAFIVLRAIVRHVLVRALWKGSEEEVKLNRSEKDIKKLWMKEVGEVKVEGSAVPSGVKARQPGLPTAFWTQDDGVSVIQSHAKAQ